MAFESGGSRSSCVRSETDQLEIVSCPKNIDPIKLWIINRKMLSNHNDIQKTDEDRQRQDRQDRTKQENASYDMSFFFSKTEKQSFFSNIKKFNTNSRSVA